jgi:hypothetical protein
MNAIKIPICRFAKMPRINHPFGACCEAYFRVGPLTNLTGALAKNPIAVSGPTILNRVPASPFAFVRPYASNTARRVPVELMSHDCLLV